ncbi:hypothetical protein [Mesorhizobium sp. WSM3862]|nr:hypothetical protein [Mesorhizobium sp. WSM3862]
MHQVATKADIASLREAIERRTRALTLGGVVAFAAVLGAALLRLI